MDSVVGIFISSGCHTFNQQTARQQNKPAKEYSSWSLPKNDLDKLPDAHTVR